MEDQEARQRQCWARGQVAKLTERKLRVLDGLAC